MSIEHRARLARATLAHRAHFALVTLAHRARFARATLAASLVFGMLANPAEARAPDTTEPYSALAGKAASYETADVDGRTRSFLVHVPRTRSGRRLPVILVFHGRGETPELIERYSALSRLRSIIVYPRGLPGRGGKLSWSGTPAAAPGVDDIRFVRVVAARLERWSCVDAGRVFATGKSDGAGLAGQLACEAADVVRAAAPVAGAFYPIGGGCRPSRPVAILEFHGTGDRVVPYGGSRKRGLPDIAAWLGAWAARDACRRAEPARTVAAGVAKSAWKACRGDVDVIGYRIDGGGHTWPGATVASGPGNTTQAISATAIIAGFFHVR